jgi:hypothetical protein
VGSCHSQRIHPLRSLYRHDHSAAYLFGNTQLLVPRLDFILHITVRGNVRIFTYLARYQLKSLTFGNDRFLNIRYNLNNIKLLVKKIKADKVNFFLMEVITIHNYYIPQNHMFYF